MTDEGNPGLVRQGRDPRGQLAAVHHALNGGDESAAGLLGGGACDTLPLGTALVGLGSLPLHDRALGGPRDHPIDADLRADLDGGLVAPALGQGLDEDDLGHGALLLEYLTHDEGQR